MGSLPNPPQQKNRLPRPNSNYKRRQASANPRAPSPKPKSEFKIVSIEVKDIKLESIEFTLEELSLLEGYHERSYKDAVFVGQIKEGSRHGKGVMKYRNGR